MQNAVEMSPKEKTSGNGQMYRIFYDFEKKIDPRGYSDPALGLYTCI